MCCSNTLATRWLEPQAFSEQIFHDYLPPRHDSNSMSKTRKKWKDIIIISIHSVVSQLLIDDPCNLLTSSWWLMGFYSVFCCCYPTVPQPHSQLGEKGGRRHFPSHSPKHELYYVQPPLCNLRRHCLSRCHALKIGEYVVLVQCTWMVHVIINLFCMVICCGGARRAHRPCCRWSIPACPMILFVSVSITPRLFMFPPSFICV